MSEKKLVEVAIALVFRQGQVLISRRPAQAHLGGFWEFPGGKLEAGESPERCAEREVLEEVGVVVHALRTREPIRYESVPAMGGLGRIRDALRSIFP